MIEYSQEELDGKIARWKCCVSSLAYQLFKAEQYSKSTVICLYQKLKYLIRSIKALAGYTVPGTVITPGFVNTAILDVIGAGITPFPNSYSGTVIVNGTVIAAFGGVYNTLAELITDIVAAINANTGTSGYSAVDNGDGTITLTAVGGASFVIISASVLVQNFYVFATESFETAPSFARTITCTAAGRNVFAYDTPAANIRAYDGDNIITDQFPNPTQPQGHTYPGCVLTGLPAVVYDMAYRTSDNKIWAISEQYDLISISTTGTITYEDCRGFGVGQASCIIHSNNSSDDNMYICGPSVYPSGLAKVDASGTLSAVPMFDALSDNHCHASMCMDSWTGDIWIAPRYACTGNDLTVRRVQDPSGVAPNLITILSNGSLNQEISAITPYRGTTQLESRIFQAASSGSSPLPANTQNINIFDPNDLLATGPVSINNIYTDINSTIQSIYFSEMFDVLFVGCNSGVVAIYQFDPSINKLSFLQLFSSGTTRARAINKFSDNTTTSDGGSVMLVGAPTGGDEYGIIKRDTPFDIDGTLGPETPPVVSLASDNCLDSDDISNLVETNSLICCSCCESDQDLTEDIL